MLQREQGFTHVSKWISYEMFKVRTASLGRVLTCSTAALYLGYLWYKRKRTSSHHQSDKKRSSSELSELPKIEIDDQELLLALEKASRSLEVSEVVEEEPVESLVNNNCEEIMEPTISEVELQEDVSLLVNESETNAITKDSNIIYDVCLEPKIISIDSLTENLENMKINTELDHDIVKEVVEDSLSIQQVKEEPIDNEVICLNEEPCLIEVVEKKDHCECPKVVNVRKIKKDEEPMLFEGIKFKGKKKKIRKKNQARDTMVKLPIEMFSKKKIVNSPKKKIPVIEEDCDTVHFAKNRISVIEEDCDSAHSVDHNSIDTNDTQNTICSDIRSEGSQDSGKGGSSYSGEMRTVSDPDELTNYDFLVPIDLVGPIIGKKGAFVKYIKEKSNTKLIVENKADGVEDRFKMCTLVGSEININKALKLIRAKFPEKAYPELTLDYITPLVDGSLVISQLFKSELIEGINNHVIITDVVAANHFFVHNVYSPDYALLPSLNVAMNETFSNVDEVIPEVDLRTVTHGSVVAALSENNWYRAQVIDVDQKKYESANVFFLDYGGCKNVDQWHLRPMHDSLISLSFQAIECCLANIAPAYGEWCEESINKFESLTTGKMMFAQVVYKSDSIQFVNLLAFDGFETVSINDELIKYGFAIYAPPSGIYRNEVAVQEVQSEVPYTAA